MPDGEPQLQHPGRPGADVDCPGRQNSCHDGGAGRGPAVQYELRAAAAAALLGCARCCVGERGGSPVPAERRLVQHLRQLVAQQLQSLYVRCRT